MELLAAADPDFKYEHLINISVQNKPIEFPILNHYTLTIQISYLGAMLLTSLNIISTIRLFLFFPTFYLNFDHLLDIKLFYYFTFIVFLVHNVSQEGF